MTTPSLVPHTSGPTAPPAIAGVAGVRDSNASALQMAPNVGHQVTVSAKLIGRLRSLTGPLNQTI